MLLMECEFHSSAYHSGACFHNEVPSKSACAAGKHTLPRAQVYTAH